VNPYEMILGGPPSGEDQIRATAAKLRGADDRAILAMLSGDRVLAPVGAVQQRQTQTTARGLAKARQAAEELAARKQMQADDLKLRRQMNADQNQLSRDLADQTDRRLTLSAAEQRELMRSQYEQASLDRNATLEAQISHWEAQNEIARDKDKAATAEAKEKLEKTSNDETRRLSSKLGDEGVTDLEATVDIADRTVSKYFNPNTGERVSGDIPGYGAVDSMRPTALLGASGKELRNVLAGVRNKILKARSGAAVTDPEMGRLAEELGTAMGQTEQEMIQAYVNVRKALAHVKGGIYAGFAPEVVQTYESRLGANARRLAPPVIRGETGQRTSSGRSFEILP